MRPIDPNTPAALPYLHDAGESSVSILCQTLQINFAHLPGASQ